MSYISNAAKSNITPISNYTSCTTLSASNLNDTKSSTSEPTQLSMFCDNTENLTLETYSCPNTPKQQKVLPIKDTSTVNAVYNALLHSGKHGKRNAAIFALGLATGRRSSDILKFRLYDVYDFSTRSIRSKLSLKESKTGKMAIGLPVDTYTKNILIDYIRTLKNKAPDAYLFPSQKKNPDGSQRPLNVTSLNEILKANTEAICKALGDPEQTHLSSYCARKTFGYNFYKDAMENNNGMMENGIHVLDFLQAVYNHSSRLVTLRYIGAWEDAHMEVANRIAAQYALGQDNLEFEGYSRKNESKVVYM